MPKIVRLTPEVLARIAKVIEPARPYDSANPAEDWLNNIRRNVEITQAVAAIYEDFGGAAELLVAFMQYLELNGHLDNLPDPDLDPEPDLIDMIGEREW